MSSNILRVVRKHTTQDPLISIVLRLKNILLLDLFTVTDRLIEFTICKEISRHASLAMTDAPQCVPGSICCAFSPVCDRSTVSSSI